VNKIYRIPGTIRKTLTVLGRFPGPPGSDR
jgi:hypothetical protein